MRTHRPAAPRVVVHLSDVELAWNALRHLLSFCVSGCIGRARQCAEPVLCCLRSAPAAGLLERVRQTSAPKSLPKLSSTRCRSDFRRWASGTSPATLHPSNFLCVCCPDDTYRGTRVEHRQRLGDVYGGYGCVTMRFSRHTVCG
jgi:hypothetical protein